MRTLIPFIYIIFLSNYSFGIEINNLSEWRQILHFSSDNLREITDPHFYLTNSNILEDEVEAFKNTINSSDGVDLACAFPARYQLLSQSFSSVKKINLESCDELSKFLGSFKTKNLSLILASELLNAPASAFGHILLALHDEVTPEMDSDIIHFAAITNKKDGPFTYVFKGVTGGYQGFYFRNKFFEKFHEYSNTEQRYLFSYKLDINEAQKKKILYHLYELRKAKFNYYFFNENCGYRLDKLLGIIYGVTPPENKIYTLPVETAFRFQDFLGKETKVVPYSVYAKNFILNLNNKEREKFDNIIRGEQIISPKDSNDLQQAIFYYSNYQFKGKQVALKNYKKNLSLLKVTSPEHSTDEIQSPVDGKKPFMISLGGGRENENTLAALKIRPLMKSLFQYQKYNLQESELSVFNLFIMQEKNKLALQEFDVVKVKTLGVSSQYFPVVSWQGNLSFNKMNYTNDTAINSAIGLGKTLNSFIGTFSMFLNLGGDSNQEISDIYISPELYYLSYLGKIKIKFKYAKKIYSHHVVEIFRNNILYSLNKKWDISLEHFKISSEQNLKLLNMHYYF